jgi:type II secretory pathway component GspD/PulD (secretin)
MKRLFLNLILVIFCFLLFLPMTAAKDPRRLDLDFKNTDIRDVLRALANQEGVNIYIDTNVSGTITVNLSQITFGDALNILTKNNNLTYSLKNKVYHIKTVDNSFLKVTYQDGQLEVRAKDAKLSALWEAIAQKSGISLIPTVNFDEKISLTLNPTPLDDAINALLDKTNCFAEKIGTVSMIKRKNTPQYPLTLTYENDLLTLDAKNIPLPALCREITEKTKISVVPDDNVTPKISIYFEKLNLADGLDLLCTTNGLLLYQEGAAWRITRQTGSFRVRLQDGLLSVDANNVAIATLIKEIARQAKKNIILDKETSGKVTAHFQSLPFYQGLAILVENQGYMLEKKASYLYIRPNPNQDKNIHITYDPEQNLYDLDIQSAPIAAVINEMARRADLNVVIQPQVNWKVNNIRLQKLSFTQILDFLFKGTVYAYALVDGSYIIGDGLNVKPENRDFAEVKVYPIKYLKSDQLLNTLPPVFFKQNFIQIPEKNAVILTAAAEIHKLFAAYLKQIDTDSGETHTEMIRIKHLKAEDVIKVIPASITKTDLFVIKEANAISVTGPLNLVNQVKSYINTIDQVNPLIIFNITVIQISNTNGITWEAPSGIITLPNGKELKISPASSGISIAKSGTNTSNTIASLTALITNGQAKIIANPTITTLNGYKASFNVTTKYSYSVPTTVSDDGDTITETIKTYDSGLYFTITPWVSMNKEITMEIKPKISEFGDSPEGSKLPSTTERSTETTIRATDGQAVIISGLKNNRKQVSISKVPILGSIPILGYLFKNKSITETQDEFVVIIKPKLVFDEEEQAQINQQIEEGLGNETKQALVPAKD